MAYNRYQLQTLTIVKTDNTSFVVNKEHVSGFQIALDQDPTNATLPISVCNITLKNNSSYNFSKDDKIVVSIAESVGAGYRVEENDYGRGIKFLTDYLTMNNDYGTTVAMDGTASGTSITFIFYVSKIDLSNENEIRIDGVDYIGLLDESYFEGTYENGATPRSIIEDILEDTGATICWNSSATLPTIKPVFENQTKRQALQQVLFAVGLRVRTNAGFYGQGDIEIYDEPTMATTKINNDTVYRGSSLIKNSEVNGVSITSHDYKIDDFGTVVVGEKRFKDVNKVKTLRRDSDNENVISVSLAVCIQESNLDDIALRIYNDYQRTDQLSFEYVWSGEFIGQKISIEGEDGMHTGFIKKLFLDIGVMSIYASAVIGIPNENIISPTETETQTITSTGSLSNEVTYNELFDLVSKNQLVAGATYRITDYEALVDPYNGSVYEEITTNNICKFDILVKAINSNTLSEDADVCAAQRGGPAHADVTKWKVKYSLFCDKKYYSWANDKFSTSSHGSFFLYERNTNYWTFVNAGTYKYTKPFPKENDYLYNDTSLTSQYDVLEGRYWMRGIVFHMVDERGNEAPYDFKNIKLARYLFSSVSSSSSFVNKGYALCKDNSGNYHPSNLSSSNLTKSYYYTFDDGNHNDASIDSSKTQLNNVVKKYLLSTGQMKIPHVCFVGSCKNNTILDNARYLTLLDCNNTYVESGVYNGNITGNYNTIKTSSNEFNLDNACTRCKVGASGTYIFIKNGTDVTIGASCTNVTLSGTSIKIGDRCGYISLATSMNVTIGSACGYITFVRSTNKNITIDAGNMYLKFDSPDHSGGVQNIHVESGAHVSTTEYTVYKLASNVSTSIYVYGPLGEMMEMTNKINIPLEVISGSRFAVIGTGMYCAVVANRASIRRNEYIVVDDLYDDNYYADYLYYDGQGYVHLVESAQQDDQVILYAFRVCAI